MLRTRLITAAIGIPIVAAIIWVGGWWLTGLVAAAVAVAVLEFSAARGILRTPMAVSVGLLAAGMVVAAKLGGAWPERTLTALAIAPIALLALSKDPAEDVPHWLWSVATAFYIGWLASRFIPLRLLPDGRYWLFLGVLTVWLTDTGAYFIGRLVGRHKMAPAISPGKTWEGAIAGQVWGFVSVLGLKEAFGLDIGWVDAAVLGFLLPFAAQVGDLAESALKRGLGVKDSSGLVPGHGGLADRLDSLLFALPALYYYLEWRLL